MTKTQRKIEAMTSTNNVDAIGVKNIRCKNCMYCLIVPFGKSTCRALPPYFPYSGYDGNNKRWPEVDKDNDWCGKFEARDEVNEPYDKNDSSALRYALERINEGIVRTGPNTIGTSLNLVEIKTIAETALGIADAEMASR